MTAYFGLAKVGIQPMAGARFDKVSTTKLPINPCASMTGLEWADSKPLHPLRVSWSHSSLPPQELDNAAAVKAVRLN